MKRLFVTITTDQFRPNQFWLERFALVIIALIFWNWVLNNGHQMDAQFRIATGLIVLGVSYAVAHAIYLETRKRTATNPGSIPNASQAQPGPPPAPTGTASTTGPCSPVVTGSGNTTTANCEDPLKDPTHSVASISTADVKSEEGGTRSGPSRHTTPHAEDRPEFLVAGHHLLHEFRCSARNVGSVEAVGVLERILFGNDNQLMQLTAGEYRPGQNVAPGMGFALRIGANFSPPDPEYVILCLQYFDAPYFENRVRYSQCFYFVRDKARTDGAIRIVSGEEKDRLHAQARPLLGDFDVPKQQLAPLIGDVANVAKHDTPQTRAALRQKTLAMVVRLEAVYRMDMRIKDAPYPMEPVKRIERSRMLAGQLRRRWMEEFDGEARALLFQYQAIGSKDTESLSGDMTNGPTGTFALGRIVEGFRSLASGLQSQ